MIRDTMKFEHDCESCSFIRHIGGMDIYLCKGPDPSIIALFSSKGSDYTSMSLEVFKRQIKTNVNVEGTLQDGTKWNMNFGDYLMSDKVINYHKAWLIGLAML